MSGRAANLFPAVMPKGFAFPDLTKGMALLTLVPQTETCLPEELSWQGAPIEGYSDDICILFQIHQLHDNMGNDPDPCMSETDLPLILAGKIYEFLKLLKGLSARTT